MISSAADFDGNELATLLSSIISQSITDFAETNNAMMIKLDLKNDYHELNRRRRGTANELTFTAGIEHEFTALRDLIDSDDFISTIESNLAQQIATDIDQKTDHVAHLEATNTSSNKRIQGIYNLSRN